MYVVVIAWIYVVLMASVAEAVSSTGTVLGAIVTFLLYGLLPLGIVVYIMGTPGRKRMLKAREMAERTEAARPSEPDNANSAPSGSAAPDARGETTAGAKPGAVTPVGKKP